MTGSRLRGRRRRGAAEGEVLLDRERDATGDGMLASGAGGDRGLEGVGYEERFD